MGSKTFGNWVFFFYPCLQRCSRSLQGLQALQALQSQHLDFFPGKLTCAELPLGCPKSLSSQVFISLN